MIIFLYGRDDFRAKRKLKEILERYQKIHKSNLNLKILDLKEKSYEDFKKEAFTLPFFKEKKLLVLKNSSLNSDFQKKFLSEIEKFKGNDIFLVFIEEGEVKKNEFFESLKKNSKFEEFKPLNYAQLKFWVKKEFERLKREIDEKAIESLIERVGADLWEMENEIKKLVSYRKDGKIILEDVEKLVPKNEEAEVFRVIENFLKGEKKEGLRLLKKIFEKDQSQTAFFFFLKSQIKNLLILKDLSLRKISLKELASKTKFNPYFIEKSLELIKRFSLFELKKLYFKVLELEVRMKTQNLSPEIFLSLFFIRYFKEKSGQL